MKQTYDDVVASALEVAEYGAIVLDERCDRCGGRAESRVELRTGVLYFCRVCFRRHSAALAAAVKVPRRL